MRLLIGKEGKRVKIEEGLPYVAVIIAPPQAPQAGVTLLGDSEKAEQSGEPEPPITRILKS